MSLLSRAKAVNTLGARIPVLNVPIKRNVTQRPIAYAAAAPLRPRLRSDSVGVFAVGARRRLSERAASGGVTSEKAVSSTPYPNSEQKEERLSEIEDAELRAGIFGAEEWQEAVVPDEEEADAARTLGSAAPSAANMHAHVTPEEFVQKQSQIMNERWEEFAGPHKNVRSLQLQWYRDFARIDRMERQLPQGLKNAVDLVLKDYRYRSRTNEQWLFKYYPVWFLANRATSVHGILARIFNEVRNRVPDLHTHSLLEFGSKSSPALWAAREVWSTRLESYFGIEKDHRFLKMAKLIHEDAPTPGTAVAWQKAFNTSRLGAHPIVVSAYSLQSVDFHSSLTELWKSVTEGGVLILVERGDKDGFKLIREARAYLLKKYTKSEDEAASAGASAAASAVPHVIAPCPHSHACPMAGLKRSCTFGFRLPRYAFPERSPQKVTKPSKRARRDDIIEEFSYVVLRKGKAPGSHLPRDPANPTTVAHEWARVLAPALKRKRRVIIDVCNPTGELERRLVGKKHPLPGAYRQAKVTQWGDYWPFPSKMSLRHSPNSWVKLIQEVRLLKELARANRQDARDVTELNEAGEFRLGDYVDVDLAEAEKQGQAAEASAFDDEALLDIATASESSD